MMPLQVKVLVIAILGLALSGCGQEIAHLKHRTGPVVILGDSLAAGVGSASKAGFVGLLSERLGLEIVNRGVPGNTTAQGLARLDKDVLELDPALAIVELGGNDALQKVELDTTFSNLGTIIDRLHAREIPVLLLGVRGGVFSDKFAARFEDLASEKKVAFVPNILEGILTSPALKDDSIHPNDAGYAVVADRVEPTLRFMLEKMGRI